MNKFVLVIALFSQTVFAGALTSSITRDVSADGRWSFTFSGSCSEVKDVQLPLGVKETLDAKDGRKVKLSVSAPVPVDTERRGSRICSYQCPTGTMAIALSLMNSKSHLLSCVVTE